MLKAYLCCPYSHSDEAVREIRFRMANRAAARLMEQGYCVFSPISHSHPISRFVNTNPNDSKFYLQQDLPWLTCCDIVFVLALPGWRESTGIAAELEYAGERPIRYLDPVTLEEIDNNVAIENGTSVCR